MAYLFIFIPQTTCSRIYDLNRYNILYTFIENTLYKSENLSSWKICKFYLKYCLICISKNTHTHTPAANAKPWLLFFAICNSISLSGQRLKLQKMSCIPFVLQRTFALLHFKAIWMAKKYCHSELFRGERGNSKFSAN